MESPARQRIDTRGVLTNLDSRTLMTASAFTIGQVWRKLETGETFLVTKIYNEALATIAVLRPTGAATESMIRVRGRPPRGQSSLPGYSMLRSMKASRVRALRAASPQRSGSARCAIWRLRGVPPLAARRKVFPFTPTAPLAS